VSDNNLNRRDFLVVSGGVVMTASMYGCGSHSKLLPPPSETKAGGRIQLTIAWPDTQNPSRYIPTYAGSLYFELYKQETPQSRYQLIVNRPVDKSDTQTVSFDSLLPVGNYILAGVARTGSDGQGSTVASAATTLEVKNGETANAQLVLKSTIQKIEILGQPLTIKIGSTLILTGRALDPDGKIVFLPSGALSWSVVSGSEFATITSEGNLITSKIGTCRVRFAEVGANLSAEADIVVSESKTSGLADTAWPRFRGDSANSGVGPTSGVEPTGQKAWETQLDASPTTMCISFDNNLLVGTSSGRVYCLDGLTGTKKWNIQISTNGISGMAISADYNTYITSTNGTLYALDLKTLNKKWEIILGLFLAASPNISFDGTVYVGSAGRPGDTGNNNDNGLLNAIDSNSGTKKWEIVLGSSAARSSPAIGLDGSIYIGSFGVENGSISGKLNSINSVTGLKNWEYSTRGFLYTSAAVKDDTVFFMSNGSQAISALNRTTGIEKWKRNILYITQGTTQTPIVTDNTVYFYRQTSSGNFYDIEINAIDISEGKIKWTSLIESGGLMLSEESSSLSLGNNNLYFLRSSGDLFCINSSNGNIKWFISLGGNAGGYHKEPLINKNGYVYVATDNKIYAIN
jgi:outer membrane protein assembly factor BamB